MNAYLKRLEAGERGAESRAAQDAELEALKTAEDGGTFARRRAHTKRGAPWGRVYPI